MIKGIEEPFTFKGKKEEKKRMLVIFIFLLSLLFVTKLFLQNKQIDWALSRFIFKIGLCSSYFLD